MLARKRNPDTPAAQAFARLKAHKPLTPTRKPKARQNLPVLAKNGTPAAVAHRKVKLKSVNWWKKKAWTVFSLWIRKRDKFVCYTCGAEGRQAGHFISRQFGNVLYDEMNVHAQCYMCNSWKAGNIGIYSENLIRDYGIAAFQDLLRRGRRPKQFTIEELQGIIAKYSLPPP